MSGMQLTLLFSPQNCSLELLEHNLTTSRLALAKRLLDGLKDAVAQGAGRYDLVIGARGTGKTHLLTYVAKRLRDSMPEDALCIVRLPEESLGIASYSDFLTACLEAAGHAPPDLYELAPGPDSVRELEIRLVNAFQQRPAVLIVENLDSILDALEEAEHRQLRSLLQRHSGISVLAAAPALFNRSARGDHPFHGFFLLHHLAPLSPGEARDFLIQLAEWNEDTELAARLRTDMARARVNAIHDLTGGNHRLLGMLAEFLRADDLHSLVEPFVRMVDRELTPYYQGRLQLLPAQQQKILRTMARQHGAVPVKAIARQCGITEQVASSQLRALREAALVQSEQHGRESYYELLEPMLRLVLDIKEGRNQLLPSIIGLVRAWYEADELKELVPSYEYHAVNDAVRESAAPIGAKSLESATSLQIHEGYALAKHGRIGEALDIFGAICQQHKHAAERPLREMSGIALVNRFILESISDADLADMAERLADAIDGVVVWLRRLIDALLARPHDLKRLAEQRPIQRLLVLALTQWVQDQLPMTEETARDHAKAEQALTTAFGSVEEAARVLDIFQAARAYSLGNSKALMRLPLESRRLVRARYGEESPPPRRRR